jgi:hypothetical protein
MVSHHEISAIADIDHPANGADEDSDSRFIHTCQVASGNHQIA